MTHVSASGRVGTDEHDVLVPCPACLARLIVGTRVTGGPGTVGTVVSASGTVVSVLWDRSSYPHTYPRDTDYLSEA